MKKTTFYICMVFVVILFCLVPARARAGNRTPARNPANRQTLLNSVTDFFSTLGMSAREKENTLKERKQQRREVRLRQARRKRAALIRRRMKKQEKIIMEKIKARNKALSR